MKFGKVRSSVAAHESKCDAIKRIGDFKESDPALTPMGKLFIALVEEDSWSCDYTVDFVIPDDGIYGECILWVQSEDFPSGSTIKIGSKDASTLAQVEAFIIEKCDEWAGVLQSAITDINRTRERLTARALQNKFRDAKHVAQIVEAIDSVMTIEFAGFRTYAEKDWRENIRHQRYLPTTSGPTGEWVNWEMFFGEGFLAFSDLESGRVKVLFQKRPSGVILSLPRASSGMIAPEVINGLIAGIPDAVSVNSF